MQTPLRKTTNLIITHLTSKLRSKMRTASKKALRLRIKQVDSLSKLPETQRTIRMTTTRRQNLKKKTKMMMAKMQNMMKKSSKTKKVKKMTLKNLRYTLKSQKGSLKPSRFRANFATRMKNS